MSYLKINLSDLAIEDVCKQLKEKFLDVVQTFDYTVFRHYEEKDQTSIQGVNVDKTGSVLTLSKMVKIDYIHDNRDYMWGGGPSSYKPITYEFYISAKIIDDKVNRVTINVMSSSGNSYRESSMGNEVFKISVGDEKYLINSTFYDKSDFSGYVFQQATIDKPTPFGIEYVYEIIQKLRV